MHRLGAVLLCLAIGLCTVSTCTGQSVVATFIVRDEEVNLKVNLPLWAQVIDYFTFVLDSRTVDGSRVAIESILKSANRPFVIETHEFNGFGEARTKSLDLAWRSFPIANYVLIADPDWRPELSTIRTLDLTGAVDVYRFTVFDRSGLTRRRVDWLLKHRAGLSMKYRLHEVLSIGMYSFKEIGWIIHEVEQIGSWHSTVGHGDSHSIARLNFDLSLLLQDLDDFGCDPHTYYYLAVTYHGIAEKSLVQTGLLNSFAAENTVKYGLLRLNSQFEAEFMEERWAIMYLLGSTYTIITPNFVDAVRWLSLCRDYNPKQAECSALLVRLYLSHLMLEKAVDELDKILTSGHFDRLMLNTLGVQDCMIPQLVVDVFAVKARARTMTTAEAKYMLLMVHQLKTAECKISENLQKEVWSSISPILAHQADYSVQASSSTSQICSQPDLVQYLVFKKYVVHPCGDLREQYRVQETCMMYMSNIPPALEELQNSIGNTGFLGTASMADILHHVWGSDIGVLTKRTASRPFRILFAEYFNPKIVENVIGYFHRNRLPHFEVHVISSDLRKLVAINESLSFCGSLLNFPSATKLVLKHGTIQKNLGQESSLRFDYVEYNGGLSISSHAVSELTLLARRLTDDGVIGMSYFSRNVHQQTIHDIVRGLNQTSFPPFSYETVRAIRAYLAIHGMEFLNQDLELLIFLGAEPAERSGPPGSPKDVIASLNWKPYDKREVMSILQSAGLVSQAWIPTAYSQPYELLDHYAVQRFKSMGISEDEFLNKFMTQFRYSLYARRSGSCVNALSRPIISADLLKSDVASKVFVVDRLGSLSSSLSALLPTARSGALGSIAFAPYSLNKKFALEFTVSPRMAAALAILSDGISLMSLIKAAYEFQFNSADNPSLDDIAISLSSVLDYFERINAITYVRFDAPSSNNCLNSDVGESLLISNENQLQAQRMRDLGFDEEFIGESLGIQETVVSDQVDNLASNQEQIADRYSIDSSETSLKDKRSSVISPSELNPEQIISSNLGDSSETSLKSKLSSIINILQEKHTPKFDKIPALKALQQLRKITTSGGILDEDVKDDQNMEELRNYSIDAEGILIQVKTTDVDANFRRANCVSRISLPDKSCLESKPVKRKTASLQSTSLTKVRFDLWLCDNIMLDAKDETAAVVTNMIEALQHAKQYLESLKISENKHVKISSKDIGRHAEYLNHAVFVASGNPPKNHTLLHWGAIQQLHVIRDQKAIEGNDFVVLDTLLQHQTAQYLHSALMQSFLWFDVTNGAAFASHWDDGLNKIESLSSLARQLALAMSSGVSGQWNVKKLFAIALPVNVTTSSPVSLVNRNELAAVLWISDGGLSCVDDCGMNLQIFDSLAADCLFGQGASFYPSVHPEFLSKGGDLNINVTERCGSYHSEIIPAANNRMVVVRDRIPFFFNRVGHASQAGDPAMVLVIHLSKK